MFWQWFVEEAEEGWEMGTLGDVLELVHGKGLKEEIRSGTGFPVVVSSGILGYHSEFLVECPGVVIGRKGTLGRVIIFLRIFFPNREIALSTEINIPQFKRVKEYNSYCATLF